MIIVMSRMQPSEQIEGVVKKLKEAGLDANISRGTERTVIGAIGDERKLSRKCSTPCRAWNGHAHRQAVQDRGARMAQGKHRDRHQAASRWAASRSRSSAGRARWKRRSRWICRRSMCMRQVAA